MEANRINMWHTFWKISVLLLLSLLFVFVRSVRADETYWVIQVASYDVPKNGEKDLERLKIRQFPQVRLEKMDQSAYPYKLLVGRFSAKEEGEAVLQRVQTLFPSAFKRSFTIALPPGRMAPNKPQEVKSAPSPKKQPVPGASVKEPFQPLPVRSSVKAVSTEDSRNDADVVRAEEFPVTESQTVIPFDTLGYPPETYLPGSSPVFVFHLLRTKGLLQAEAELVVRLSNVLSENSALTVEVNDIPQFTKSIKEIGYAPRLSFPIPLTSSEHIKVSVRGHLFVTEEVCDDPVSGKIWMVVSNKSRLKLTGENIKAEQISDFFKNYKHQIDVVLDPEKASFAALPLFYYLHPLNDWKKINVTLTDKISPERSTIRVGKYAQDLEIQDGELFVDEDKVHLLKKELHPLYITSSVRESEWVEENRKKGTIRFEDMGIAHFNTTGIGDMTMSVPLHYSLFSGVPKRLRLTLMASHTPIPSGDKAFLRIFLNKLLLKAVQLEGGGQLRAYHVDIPEERLEVYNNRLEVVASYFPDHGRCQGGDPRMTFSVSNDSRFEYQTVTRQAIHRVVDVMGSMSGKVLLMMDDRKMFLPGVHFMDLLGKFNKEIGNIVVQPWSGKIPEGYDFVLLLLNPENTKDLDLPVKLDQGRFSIVNPVTQTNLFRSLPTEKKEKQDIARFEYQSEFGIFQIFDVQETKVLLLSYYKDPRALDFLKTITVEEIGRFNGNVVLFNRSIVSYQVGDKFRILYQEARSFPYYFSRFKLPIVIFGVLGLLVFLCYINKRLVRED